MSKTTIVAVAAMATALKYAQYAAAVFAVAFLGAMESAQAQSWVTGQWTQPYTTPVHPVHAAISPDGKKILLVGGSRNSGSSRFRAGVLNLETGAVVDRDIPTDLFCNAATFLPDGRVLFIGGTNGSLPKGARSTVIFDWTTERWIIGPLMADGRWYPTSTVLPDGRTMTISGENSKGERNNTVEIFTPNAGTGSWSGPYPTARFPRYLQQHMFPLNGGTDWAVFLSGPMTASWMYRPPMGWSRVATSPNGSGDSVLLTLHPENGYKPIVLTLGGDETTSANNRAQTIDLSVSPPVWKPVAPMAEVRKFQNATLLPNGNVVVTGGSTNAPLAEIFDPTRRTWTVGARGNILRGYHSVALLLPDGRVLKAGSNPAGDGAKFEKRIEIYSPPYLFQGPRPVIANAPASIAYGQVFGLGFQSGQGVGSVVLMRLGADTHGFNMEQRGVRLIFSNPSAGVLNVTAPPSGIIAPPGYYMLFLVDAAGVPSVAAFVRLG